MHIFYTMQNKKTCSIQIEGWKNPLTIEYAISTPDYNIQYVYWKVEDTQHIFQIPLKIIYTKHNSVFEDHFKKTLVVFRQDYITWWKGNWKETWMKDYWDFSKYIILKL